MRSLLAAVIVAANAFAAVPDSPTFRATLTLVKADLEVYDRQTHAPILGLTRSDFQVADEDQPREIAYFGDASGPLDLLFLLDVSGSVADILPRIANYAAGALSVLQPGDRSAVMAFSKRTVLLQPFSGDFEVVAGGIAGALTVRIGLDTDINQALWSAADYFHREGGASRRAILIITDNSQVTPIPDAVVEEQLAAADATVDGLLVHGLFPLPRVTHPGILGFARNSGGEVIEGSHPEARLAEMIGRIKHRYSLHFRPVETSSPRPRRIHVELSPDARRRYPHAVVRARRIYFPRLFKIKGP